MKIILLAGLLIAAILLSGCISPVEIEVDQRYVLTNTELAMHGIVFEKPPQAKMTKDSSIFVDLGEDVLKNLKVSFSDSQKELSYEIAFLEEESVAKTSMDAFRPINEAIAARILEKDQFADSSITTINADYIDSQFRYKSILVFVSVHPQEEFSFEKIQKINNLIIEKIQQAETNN